MTESEHKLMVTMFTRQAKTIRVLENILRSHKLLDDNSLKGARAAVDFEESQNPEIGPMTLAVYQKTANELIGDSPDQRAR
jgi:hypothetical protein